MKENKKKFFKVKELQTKVSNSDSKVGFLMRCLKLRVVPNTLQVRNAASENLAWVARESWHDAQLRGGLTLTRETNVRQGEECSRLRIELRRSKTALEELAGPDNWPYLESRLNRDQRIAYKAANNRTRQRLRLLIVRAGRVVKRWLNRSGHSFMETTVVEQEGGITCVLQTYRL